jgi:hypothetical protein
MMSGWVGFGAKKPENKSVKGENAEGAQDVPAATKPNPPSAVRQGLQRMGTWAGVKPTGQDDEEDDRHIRFKIGGAGRRLTKEDFLKELQSLDPKARCEIIKESDAPEEMKELARKDASKDVPGSNRLYGAKDAILVSRTSAAGAQKRRVGTSDHEDSDDELPRPRTTRGRSKPEISKAGPAQSRQVSNSPSDDDDLVESAAERRRRQQALRGVEDEDDISPGRGRSRETEKPDEGADVEESAAERRRREAALGGPAQDDSDDDDTPRVPPPVAKPSRGIRFAQSPVRGRN